ncbi:holo-ACP synthase [Thermoflexus hugenholtzii]|jgi:phosphopantethiene--protein transferase domain|uniref:Holo-[acyl-carrier-protein] synthase n=1 Tax=Thermoflexus hugenholtzii JAD2 TaxID=877466 RepID=A0A212R828_9CHLR|nr:holo-ACP synthase [Thermoflexus hugenholtzii]SNB68183.1 holo-[acyl-carrier protein] synthase [Thermoflexus hugenholtzii JAD2]
MIAIGVDILEIRRMEQAIARFGDRLLRRVFTPAERQACRGRVAEYAARFAAKEAVAKALGVGLRIMAREGIGFHDVEILPDHRGQPHVHLRGWAAERARVLGLKQWAVSMTHDGGFAIAVVASIGGLSSLDLPPEHRS